jgi:hypothetical protein
MEHKANLSVASIVNVKNTRCFDSTSMFPCCGAQIKGNSNFIYITFKTLSMTKYTTILWNKVPSTFMQRTDDSPVSLI